MLMSMATLSPYGLAKAGLIVKLGRKMQIIPKAKVNRDALRRSERRGEDIQTSKKLAKKLSKRKGGKPIQDAGHTDRGGNIGRNHYHRSDRSGNHTFYSTAIPGAYLGNDIFGDNFFGDTANFFNPLIDIQELIDLYDDLTMEGDASDCN